MPARVMLRVRETAMERRERRKISTLLVEITDKRGQAGRKKWSTRNI